MYLRYIGFRLWMSDKGASLAEYALLVLLIAIVALVALTLGGQEVSTQYSGIASSLSND